MTLPDPFKIRWPKVLTEGDFRKWKIVYGRWERRMLDYWWEKRFNGR